MCTLVIDIRPDDDWPVVLAGNRDEMSDRPWQAPARHWPDRPEVRAGLDELAEGSWFAVADHGVVATILNRRGTLGPAHNKRSRGELVLDAVEYGSAQEAAEAMAHLDPEAYRGFNLIIADPKGAYCLSHLGLSHQGSPVDEGEAISVQAIPPGIHLIDAMDLDDANSPRVQRWLPQFATAPRPSDELASWQAWIDLLAAQAPLDINAPDQVQQARASMKVDLPMQDGSNRRFATVCSQLLAIPKYPGFSGGLPFWFAAGAPGEASYEPVAK